MQNMEQQSADRKDCWNSIGVWSQISERCTRLQDVIHCQNCDIYQQAGRSRLNQQADADYLQEWSDNLAQKPGDDYRNEHSAIVFNLGQETYALSTSVLSDVTHPRQAHRIPHRSNNVLTGLVNIRGELVLCISLAGLLGLRNQQAADTGRMIVAQLGELTVAFKVDRVDGISHYAKDTLQEPPATLSNHDGNYIHGLLDSQDGQVGLLNHKHIQNRINRMLR